MVVPKGFVVIDIDDKDMSVKVENFIKTRGYKCITSDTGNGKHFMFKIPKGMDIAQTSALLAYGMFPLDTKVGGKNGYIAVKFIPDADQSINPTGMRLENHELSLNEVDELPIELTPLPQQRGEKKQDIIVNG